jgi:uncharacterized membrane protein
VIFHLLYVLVAILNAFISAMIFTRRWRPGPTATAVLWLFLAAVFLTWAAAG